MNRKRFDAAGAAVTDLQVTGLQIVGGAAAA
jgi:hypothetical protein